MLKYYVYRGAAGLPVDAKMFSSVEEAELHLQKWQSIENFTDFFIGEVEIVYVRSNIGNRSCTKRFVLEI